MYLSTFMRFCMCVVCHIAGEVRVCVAGVPCVCGCVSCWRGYPAGVAGVCGWLGVPPQFALSGGGVLANPRTRSRSCVLAWVVPGCSGTFRHRRRCQRQPFLWLHLQGCRTLRRLRGTLCGHLPALCARLVSLSCVLVYRVFVCLSTFVWFSGCVVCHMAGEV